VKLKISQFPILNKGRKKLNILKMFIKEEFKVKPILFLIRKNNQILFSHKTFCL